MSKTRVQKQPVELSITSGDGCLMWWSAQKRGQVPERRLNTLWRAKSAGFTSKGPAPAACVTAFQESQNPQSYLLGNTASFVTRAESRFCRHEEAQQLQRGSVRALHHLQTHFPQIADFFQDCRAVLCLGFVQALL